MGALVGGSNGIVSGLSSTKQYQRFTSNGLWHKPTGASMIVIEIIGGGASGAGGGHPNHDGGGGGGGGAIFRQIMPAESIPNTLTVVVAAEVNGQPTDTNGLAGNFSSVSDGTFTLSLIHI